MNKRQPNSEAASLAISTDKTLGSVWRSNCANLSWHSDLPPLLRAMKRAAARFGLRLVRHATFDQLFSAGYDVQTFDDGAMPLGPEKIVRGVLPDGWKIPQSVIMPKIATLRDAVVFSIGLVLLPDGRYCFSDTRFAGEGYLKSPRKFFARKGMFFHADPKTISTLTQHRMRCIDIPGRCFSTIAGKKGNFGHFVHDVLSRIYYEDLGALVPGRDRVIAPPLRMPMQKALFRKIFEGYEIVWVPPDVAIRVEKLLLPANLCTRASFNPAAIAALAGRMRRIMEPYEQVERRKVCVSRSDGTRRWGMQAHGRDFVNMEAYETLMRKKGYQIANVSTLGPEAQLSLWGNTSDIVGIHGAGMMNMIMMPSGGNYTEIAVATPQGKPFSQSWTIRCAMAAGHRVNVLLCAENAQGSMEIDLDRLEALLISAC